MNQKNNLFKQGMIAIFWAIIAIIADQYTKLWAVAHLKGQSSIPVIQDVFELHYLENRGAAFGMLQNQRIFFLIASVIILSLVVFFFIRMPQTKRFIPLRISFVMIAAGAIGNTIDRIRLNYVIDFFYFKLIDFPIFNVADIYVSVAAVLLFILILFYYKEEDLEVLFQLFKRK